MRVGGDVKLTEEVGVGGGVKLTKGEGEGQE